MSSSINNDQLRSFRCHAIAELTTNMRHHNPKKHRNCFHAKSAPSQLLSCQICTITELTTNVEESRPSQVIASARLTTRHSYTRTLSQKENCDLLIWILFMLYSCADGHIPFYFFWLIVVLCGCFLVVFCLDEDCNPGGGDCGRLLRLCGAFCLTEDNDLVNDFLFICDWTIRSDSTWSKKKGPFHRKTLLHTDIFHTDPFTHKYLYTLTHLQTQIHTLLHTNPFTPRPFYTQTLIRTFFFCSTRCLT